MLLPAVLLALQAFTYERNVGVSYVANGRLCMMMQNDELQPKWEVFVVKPFAPQRAVSAEVSGRDCPALRGIAGTAYQLMPAEQTVPGIGIAILWPLTPLVIDHGVVRGDLDKDGKEEHFRACTSGEGLHLSIWRGKPLKSTRQWHLYVPLGYDVEKPDCTEKDY